VSLDFEEESDIPKLNCQLEAGVGRFCVTSGRRVFCCIGTLAVKALVLVHSTMNQGEMPWTVRRWKGLTLRPPLTINIHTSQGVGVILCLFLEKHEGILLCL
jgi:hypothetical protein